ncbi:zinc finger protein 395-like [Limulus polyphemus]|uniref:Zinc finger protein 395-like n=1 Tax=Limulus polyphemus TaxID=6850 RepID=A0ABM1THV9_LIMPO|nr:zinc finger protein 395-like [Limulus polyphemus]
MSTGKRLAKRSILGTRVSVPLEDGLYYPGVIRATKADERNQENIYCVQLENKENREFLFHELIGPGFQSIFRVKLKKGQRVFVTYKGREVAGLVDHHRPNLDQVMITVEPSSPNPHVTKPTLLKKKLEEVRLLESRKSARLQDLDTDYSRLAEGQFEIRRRPPSLTIEVPTLQSGRKRRPSSTDDGDVMNDCSAAMVLMSLSCSPKSPRRSDSGLYAYSWTSSTSSGFQEWDSPRSDTRTATPSPPSPLVVMETVTSGQVSDEGIEMDETVGFMEEPLSEKRKTRTLFQCTWPGCGKQYYLCEDVEKHVRMRHLRRSKTQISDLSDDHEEEFYYTEIEIDHHPTPPPASPEGSTDSVLLSPELANIYTSSAPTLSHLDMVKPPHENPEYREPQKEREQSITSLTNPVTISNFQPILHWQPHPYAVSAPSDMALSPKYLRLSPKSFSPTIKGSPTHRKGRSEIRKCRKVYGMENKEQWCTQCRWKKACSRFVS